MASTDRSRTTFALILLAFVALSLAASIINPLHEATDELRHYRFVRYIVDNRSLPVQGELGCRVQGHHPPLFYALGALATSWIDTGREICDAPPTNPFWGYRYWEVGVDNKNQYLHGAEEAFPWRGEALAAHIVRALNVLIGAGVVWMTWLIGRAIWPGRPYLALGGVAFVAFNPMFVYMAGAINNDVIAALSGSAVTLACVRLLKDEDGLRRRWGVILGLLFGLALMSKFNLAAVSLLIEAVVTWVAWRKRQWRAWWQVNLIIAFFTLLLAGWWFLRNQLLYGEPTGFQRLTELWGVRDPLRSWGVAVFEIPYAWTSLWGRFGYGQIPLPEAIYDGLRWLTIIALLGLPLPLMLRRRSVLGKIKPPLLFLGLNAALFFGVLFTYLLVSPAGPMGRFFFPALPSLSILIFAGLERWTALVGGARVGAGEIATRPAILLAAAVNVGMAALTMVALFGYLAPAYARPAGFDPGAALPHPVNAQFDTLVNLRGYDVDESVVYPGDEITVDLYWEVTGRPPGNYLLFLHLIDDTGVIVAQRDTHPGLGNFPSKEWRPGDRFVETVRLVVPETAYTDSVATLSVGLYERGAYRLAISSEAGDPLGDALPLAEVEIRSRPSDYPNPLDQNFNNEIRLIGYEYGRRQLRPGDDLRVTLYWEAIQTTPADYIVQVLLLDDSGASVAAADGRPQNSESPTSEWATGQVIRDEHLLSLDEAILPGAYVVQVSLVDVGTKVPQNIVAEDGHWIDNRLLLSRVLIQP